MRAVTACRLSIDAFRPVAHPGSVVSAPSVPLATLTDSATSDGGAHERVHLPIDRLVREQLAERATAGAHVGQQLPGDLASVSEALVVTIAQCSPTAASSFTYAQSGSGVPAVDARTSSIDSPSRLSDPRDTTDSVVTNGRTSFDSSKRDLDARAAELDARHRARHPCR